MTDETKPPHALAMELRAIANEIAASKAGRREIFLTEEAARFVAIAADSIEFSSKTEWVNADILRMAKDLERQADDLRDWHDPTGRRRGRLMRAAAGLRVVCANLGEGPVECGEKAPSGRCRRERGHKPPWAHQGDSPDAYLASAGKLCTDPLCPLPHAFDGGARWHVRPKASG